MEEDATLTEVCTPLEIRCASCRTLNRVDLARVRERPACGQCHKPIPLDRPLAVSEEDFERTVLAATVPVLVDFYADWCAPCKMVAPVVEELAREHQGRLLVAKIDTDLAPELARRFAIRGIPTLVYMKHGVEISRSVGFEPDRIRSLAEEALR